MPSSSSSVQILDDPVPPHATDTITVDTRDSDSDYDGSSGGGGGGSSPSWPAVERIASSYRSQKSLDALCRKQGVDTEQFAPLLAGDLRACSPPPKGAVCVYAEALVAGMRVPLQPFFSEVLSHFGLAPSQLAPNSWRIMAAFAALSRSAGEHSPSVAVFRHFFELRGAKVKGLYYFAGKKETAVALFTGLPDSIKGWKEGFFFLRSPVPWPCPVLWSESTKKSTADPMLTSEHKGVVEKLLRVRGAAVIDVRTYLSEDNLAAATMTPSAPKPPPPSPPCRTTDANGMDPSTYAMMQNMRAEKAATATKVAVKSEPSDTPGWTPLSGKKRKLGEDDDTKEGLCPSATHGFTSTPPGFSTGQDRKPQHAPDKRHDGDAVEWEAARQLLEGIVTPARERAFQAANSVNGIAYSYVATLQAANYATASLGHALKLQDELEKAKAELAEAKKEAAKLGHALRLQDELEKAKTELAEAKKVAAAEAESARAAAVQEFLGSEDQKSWLLKEALKGYERGMEDMKRVALQLRPDIDPARLSVPTGGFQ